MNFIELVKQHLIWFAHWLAMGWNKTDNTNSRSEASNFGSHFIIEGLTSEYVFVIDLYFLLV